MIRKELAEAVFAAMAKLSISYRDVLILRCLEQKSYSDIVYIMNCRQLRARVLFFRAKQALKRRLSHKGFKAPMLLMALSLFARLTSPAHASSTTVTATSMKVGLTAATIAAVSTKVGITVATLTTAAALTVGTATVNEVVIKAPTIITNVQQLQAMQNDLDGRYELGRNIDASETQYWNNGEGFEPVGPFTGVFDGNGYTITNLFRGVDG